MVRVMGVPRQAVRLLAGTMDRCLRNIARRQWFSVALSLPDRIHSHKPLHFSGLASLPTLSVHL